MWYEPSTIAGQQTSPTVALFTLPKPNTIPQGYKIEMKLVTDPSTNNVIQLSVNAWDNGTPIIGDNLTPPTEGPWPLPVTFDLAAILNLQFNIGGVVSAQYATFRPGSQSSPLATVSFKADSPLMVTGATNEETGESANITFDLLAEYPPNPIVQTFNAS